MKPPLSFAYIDIFSLEISNFLEMYLETHLKNYGGAFLQKSLIILQKTPSGTFDWFLNKISILLRCIYNSVKSLWWSVFAKIVQKKNFILNVRLGSKHAFVTFLWMGFNHLKATEPLQGGSLLLTTQSLGVRGTYLIDSEGWKHHPAVLNPRLLDWKFRALTITIIGKTYVKCKCPLFINIKQTLHYKAAIE